MEKRQANQHHGNNTVMSTSIKVSWKCTCKPSTTTGWIDGDNDVVYCNNCDGVITTLDKLKMTDIKRLDNIQKVIDADTYGEDTDWRDIEREIDEIRQEQADELSEM